VQFSSLVRLGDGTLAIRMTSPTGERMATRLRPMTIRDAFTVPWFRGPRR
jgi:hypothetical protein